MSVVVTIIINLAEMWHFMRMHSRICLEGLVKQDLALGSDRRTSRIRNEACSPYTCECFLQWLFVYKDICFFVFCSEVTLTWRSLEYERMKFVFVGFDVLTAVSMTLFCVTEGSHRNLI